MPYALPTSPSSPPQQNATQQEQQQHTFTHSQGRSGHRRSYSHMHITAPETTAFTSTSSSLGSLPRRRSASSAPSTPGPSVRDFGGASGDSSSGYFVAGSSSGKKPTFQLGRDDDDDDSSSEENQNQRPPKISIKRDADNDDDDEDDDDDRLRRLPPLRLKVKTSPFDTAPTPFSPPPPQQGQGQLAVPFPRSSPLTSPTNSPSIAASSVPFPAPEPLHARSVSDQPAQPDSSNPGNLATRLLRPSFSRTSSTPILLSNGRPLKSSLKSSSSSPNIPFPPQSLVPSILWPDLHRRPESPTQHQHRQHHHHHHERAASAPATPHLGSPASAETLPPSLSSSQASMSPPPSLSSSITSDSTSLSAATSSANSSGSSSPTSPSSPPSPNSFHYHHPHPPKNVHFPSQEETLATVKIFNRSARPASLSLSRVGEDTETETEGEGSGTGGNGKWGWGWSGYSGYGFGGYHNGNFRSASSSATPTAQGYPFPKVSKSPLAAGQEKEGVDEKAAVEKEWYYDIDMEHSSEVPMRGAERGEGNVYLESVGFVRADSSSPTPSRPLTLTGTLLVRNVTYQKTVAIRFTLDDWHTTNDVLAKHERSLSALPGSFWGRREGRQGEKVLSPYDLEPSGVGAGGLVFGDTPAWDRFRFHINLEDYATSESLDKRTMWLVGRYSAGIAVPSDGGGQITVLPPGGGSEVVTEWWDNNAGRNYGFGFKRFEEEKKVLVEGRERKDGVSGASGSPSGTGYRRGVILSAPSAYSPPSHLQGSGKSYPAPPQISASVSFPSGHAQAQAMYNSQHQQSPYRQQPSQLSPTLSYQQQPEGSPSVYQHLTQQHQQHQAALAETTLARLKKLNLRNYAAPTSTSPTSSASASVSPSTVTSAESTPVHTPIQDDGSRNVLSNNDDELAAEYGIDVPSSSADRRGLDIAKSRSTTPMPNTGSPSAADSMIGTTPPFSTLGSSPSVGGRAMGGGASLYWPWGSFGDVVGSLGAKKEAEARDERRESKQDQEAHWPAAAAATNADPTARGEEGANVTSLLENIKERSMGPPPVFGGPGGMMPPQRRRKDSAHRREGAAGEHEAHIRKATFSVGSGGLKKGSSSSGSGSGSDSGAGADSRSGSTTTHWNGGGGYRPGSPAPRPGLLRNPGGSLGVTGGRSSPSAVSSSSFRVSPVPSPNRSPLGTPTSSTVSMASSQLSATSSPLSSSGSTPTAAPATPTTTTTTPAAQKTDDPLYQAFVRQWCFAQGPGPGPTGSSANNGQEGPVLQVR